MIENGHISEQNMILKIDVSNWEWTSLKDIKDEILKKFRYILIEYHLSNIKKEEQLYYNVFKKINKYHQVFYIQCHERYNIVKYKNNRICKYLEVSYVIREGYQFEKDDTIYPNFELDYIGPNDNGKAEMNMNILKLFDFNE